MYPYLHRALKLPPVLHTTVSAAPAQPLTSDLVGSVRRHEAGGRARGGEGRTSVNSSKVSGAGCSRATSVVQPRAAVLSPRYFTISYVVELSSPVEISSAGVQAPPQSRRARRSTLLEPLPFVPFVMQTFASAGGFYREYRITLSPSDPARPLKSHIRDPLR